MKFQVAWGVATRQDNLKRLSISPLLAHTHHACRYRTFLLGGGECTDTQPPRVPGRRAVPKIAVRRPRQHAFHLGLVRRRGFRHRLPLPEPLAEEAQVGARKEVGALAEGPLRRRVLVGEERR